MNTEQSIARSASVIDLDTYTDLMEPSSVKETIDLGCAMVHKVLHPEHGIIILINTAGTEHGVVYS